MKKTGLLMVILLLIGSASVAQNGKASSEGVSKEEKEAKMIGFLTEKLELTTAEAESFWPVYNDLKEELKANRKAFKDTKSGKGVKLDEMSDEEVRELIDNGFEMKEKDLEIRKAYNEKFINIIGVKRTAKLYHLEKEFKKNMKGKGGKGPQGPPKGQ